jgi:hypothetical protein
MRCNRWRFSKSTIAIGVFGLAVGLLAGLTALIAGKPATGRGMGLVDDWTHHHLIFSNPGTAAEALGQGRIEEWYRIVNDPRYIMQQMKRNPAPRALATAPDFATLSARLGMPVTVPSLSIFRPSHKKAPAPSRDWAFSLGGGGVAQNMSPAKFSFNPIGTPSCANDFMVYGLNVAGTTNGQANLVALNELYSGPSGNSPYCSGHTGPSAYWAYNATNHSGTVTTSPVLSPDGSKVIYVESTSSASYLHVLVWNSADGGTATASKAPANTETKVGSCPTGTPQPSCLVTVSLGSISVTDSSPFYDYNSDTVYVGDDNGYLYKVTTVLTGTPTVTSVHVVTSEGTDTSVLTGPVYDSSGGSGNVFVGASNGALYAVTASTMAVASTTPLQIGNSSCEGSYNRILKDPPIVDSTHHWVYEYTANDSIDDVDVMQASTTLSSGAFQSTKAVTGLGSPDSGCNSSNNMYTHAPDFDNTYYTGTVTSGHMWVCGRASSGTTPNLYWIPTSGTNGALGSASQTGISAQFTSQSHGECSPITEFYNTATSTDAIFFGAGCGTGSSPPCSSTPYASFYGYTISGATGTEITPITGYPDATLNGGTSGVVIDNAAVTTTGNYPEASSVYYTVLNKTTSTTLCGATGVYCAIKVTQSALGQ